MVEICPKCGLPKELCVCETIAKERQKIKIYGEQKKFGKQYTVIEGIEGKEIDLKVLAKKLKSKLACGGTIKGGKIALQGEHRNNTKKILVDLGFAEDTIEIH